MPQIIRDGLQMKRTLFFVLGGILLGGIIHIVVVFLVPLFASQDAWARDAAVRPRRAVPCPADCPRPASEPLTSLDPRMVYAVCRFSLGDGPVRIRASLPDDFWSVAIFDRRGRNVYSLNDRVGRALAARSRGPHAGRRWRSSARTRRRRWRRRSCVELPIDVGFALLRVFVADESLLPNAIAALKTADCSGTL